MGRLKETIGYDLNPNSNKQMVKFLYEDLKLPPHRKRSKKGVQGGLTADEKTLKTLSTTYQRPELLLAISIRKSIKKLGTYLTKKNEETGEYTDSRADPDGRVRGRYNICGTETGRPSSKKTYDGTGMDMQNIPESVRPMFVAGEGKVFVVVDQWQAETFPVAVMAGSQAFLNRLQNGKKVHSMVGGWIFDKDESLLTPLEYRIAKRTVHGKDYGLGAKKFMEDINEDIIEINEGEADPSKHLSFYTLKQCKELMAKFDQFAPEIEGIYHREIRDQLNQTRMLMTPFGRKRVFRDRLGEDLYREGYAHIPQSTVAECNQLAAIKLEYLLPDGTEVIQDGFDSLLIEAEEGQVDEIKKVVEEAFKKKLFWKGVVFEIPVEMGEVDKHWKK
jgi:DNA polymerase I-like protein with 3'-5' exonuclease and polymerase domains